MLGFLIVNLGDINAWLRTKLDEKSELINKNMSVVKKDCVLLLRTVHQVVEVEDLLQIGMVGPDRSGS